MVNLLAGGDESYFPARITVNGRLCDPAKCLTSMTKCDQVRPSATNLGTVVPNFMRYLFPPSRTVHPKPQKPVWNTAWVAWASRVEVCYIKMDGLVLVVGLVAVGIAAILSSPTVLLFLKMALHRWPWAVALLSTRLAASAPSPQTINSDLTILLNNNLQGVYI